MNTAKILPTMEKTIGKFYETAPTGVRAGAAKMEQEIPWVQNMSTGFVAPRKTSLPNGVGENLHWFG